MEALAGELEAGQRALEQARWGAARLSFEGVLDVRESAQAREGLGLALWFLGEVAKGISSRECAFELYSHEGRGDDAARTAVWVSHQHFVGGRVSAARGWLARAERVLEGVGDCAGHGWVAVERARHATSLEEQIVHARRAVEIARKVRASDLEIFAVSVLGRAQVAAGRCEEGLRLLEEAMAGAAGGQVRNIHTLAEAYCNLIIASTNVGDWERATEWCELVDTFAREHEAAPLFGTCRSVHADVLFATGHWVEAERALETSLATHARYVPEMGAPTMASLAELRVRQGRLEEAERLLEGNEARPAARQVLATIALARGDLALAEDLARLCLEGEDASDPACAPLLELLVTIHLARDHLGAARTALQRLTALATGREDERTMAAADLATGRLRAAEGDQRGRSHLQAALERFSALDLPLEAARAQLELARALDPEARAGAAAEARLALETFERLGASRDADAAAELLRTLGQRSGRAWPKRYGALTKRETEVLSLLAAGRSNAQIAERLYISQRTAEHHVASILAKLGLRSRAEAAAYAVREPAEIPVVE